MKAELKAHTGLVTSGFAGELFIDAVNKNVTRAEVKVAGSDQNGISISGRVTSTEVKYTLDTHNLPLGPQPV